MTPRLHPAATAGEEQPFAHAWEHYVNAGWGVLLLPPGEKKPPPDGTTGHSGVDPNRDELARWACQRPDGNIALRAPVGVVGIDVDAYGSKTGAATLAEAERRWGPLPEAPLSTARDDGVSGIRWFRVAAGTVLGGSIGFPATGLGGIEVIQHHHRYAVVWPSIHPAGMRYFWSIGEIPRPDELPELPAAWVEALSAGAAESVEEVTAEDVVALLDRIKDGEPCARMAELLDRYKVQLEGADDGEASRHDTGCRAVLALLRCGEEGHVGAPAALQVLRDHFVSLVAGDRPGGTREAEREFGRFVTGSRGLALLAGHRPNPRCDCRGDKDERDGDNGRPSARDGLVQIALELYDLGLDDRGEPFAVPKAGPYFAQMLRGSGSLRQALLRTYFERYGRAANQQAVAEALATLEALAAINQPRPLYLRVAECGDGFALDLGDDTGRVVRIGPDGWQVQSQLPLLFRRTNLTAPLPVPMPDGDLHELWRLLNVTEADRPLLLAWLVQALAPEQAHPVLALRGQQGAGKSTAARFLVSLVDPNVVPLRKPPRDVEAWVTAAGGSWVVALDNISTIRDDLSDSLCRAVTGDGDVRRKLYTDQDLVPFRFRRAVVLTAIDVGALRGDLADRMLAIELEEIPSAQRRLDEDLARDWARAHPRALGALLDLAAQVLKVRPSLELGELPRMADYARTLGAVDRVLGTDGLATYLDQRAGLAAEVVESDPVASALLMFVRQRKGALWEGTASELLRELSDRGPMPSRFWPDTPHKLGAALKKVAPALFKAHGLRVEQTPRTRAGRGWRLAFAAGSGGAP